MVSDRIAADIWAEAVLELLDVDDLAALEIARGPEVTFLAWADWLAADVARVNAQSVADAAVAAAQEARTAAFELARKAAEIDAANPSLAISATLPARAVFRAKRVMREEELQWFASHAIPVLLLCATRPMNGTGHTDFVRCAWYDDNGRVDAPVVRETEE